MPPTPMSMPFLFASVAPPIVAFIVCLCLILWWVNTALPYYVLTSRLFFATAMDRAFPTKFAEVNKKGVPIYSTILVLVFSLVGLSITSIGGYMYTLLTGWWGFAAYNFFWLLGLSAVLLPFTYREIFERSPVKTQIAGIPVLSILGALTFGIGLWIVAYGFFRMSMEAIIVTVIFEIVGMLIFVAMQARNVKEGIDVRSVYGTLPPE